MIKKFSAAAAVALALFTASALAADLPNRKGPPPIYLPLPPPLWTGFYLGLNAGGAWSDSSSVRTMSWPVFPNGVMAVVPPRALARLASASTRAGYGGFIGGGQIGYNFQFSDRVVAGVETDIQGVANSGGGGSTVTIATVGAAAVPVLTRLSSTRSLDYLGTARGRIGWLFTPTLFTYGTGGLAYGGVSSNTSIRQFGLTNGFVGSARDGVSDTRIGWTAGAGVEWMFFPNWSAKAEYLYYDLGSVRYSGALISGGAAPAAIYATPQSSTHFNGNVARAGVNYHFNWGGGIPIIARY